MHIPNEHSPAITHSISHLNVPFIGPPNLNFNSDLIGFASNPSQRVVLNSHKEANPMSVFGYVLKNASKDLGRTVKTAADGELRNEFSMFAQTTSAHGIPMLQFESAAFPAITICNLNPFKRHLARTVPEISDTLDAFHQAVTYSKDAASHFASNRSKRSTADDPYPGGFRYVQFEPILSDCDCSLEIDRECKQKDTVPMSNYSLCICNYDRQDSSAWPCFNSTSWFESTCPDCNDIGYCNLPETKGSIHLPCLCQKYGGYCLLRPYRLKRIWEFRGKAIPDIGSPFRADFLEQLKQLGYENMTDEVAITTKTKERLVLTMAGLPVHRRIALSYGKSEFIQMCSFNGQQCDIIGDFKLHVDPAFGNCYTFNANRKNPLVSSRAGPGYGEICIGLRLMVFVNATDYLPTTEATGVRIAIHGQDEYPFPDTFGYSAPTGSVSSFGLSVRKVNRLSHPYGDCVPANRPLPDNYIYKNYKYEPEVRSVLLASVSIFLQYFKTTRNFSEMTRLLPNAFSELEKNISDCKNNHAAMIEIYYEQMSYETLTESVSYLVVNLISDIGGQAGLWLGASVITLFEMIVFVFRILTIYCRRRSDRKKSMQQVNGGMACDSRADNNGDKEKNTSSCNLDKQPIIQMDESSNEDDHVKDYNRDNDMNLLNENQYKISIYT
ncbi:unnamed protein product [Anisakis simplex]|uniref:Degenerin del-1 (inferred by orthology to a C. elegans protein) n=1 Tax=Anisakis simplex TaxID=6269 RepID=A0A158PP65_ANISI|nr:unnamed protein product [Anisakis simplex]